MPCTSSMTSTFPALAKVSVSGTLSPCLSGALRPINIMWNPPGAKLTDLPGAMVTPFAIGRMVITPFFIAIS